MKTISNGLPVSTSARFFDPTLFPDQRYDAGFFDLVQVKLPPASILHPLFPAALGNNSPVALRLLDVFTGTLNKLVPEQGSAASAGANAAVDYASQDKRGNSVWFSEQFSPAGGGSYLGDGTDASGGSEKKLIPGAESLENTYPVVIVNSRIIPGSGGAGYYRGGNGIEKTYRFLAPGIINLHDDRQHSAPWGARGGRAGQKSGKWLHKATGGHQTLAAKATAIAVDVDDQLIVRTAGAGGWGDPLQRDLGLMQRDLLQGSMTPEQALDSYGVVLSEIVAK